MVCVLSAVFKRFTLKGIPIVTLNMSNVWTQKHSVTIRGRKRAKVKTWQAHPIGRQKTENTARVLRQKRSRWSGGELMDEWVVYATGLMGRWEVRWWGMVRTRGLIAGQGGLSGSGKTTTDMAGEKSREGKCDIRTDKAFWIWNDNEPRLNFFNWLRGYQVFHKQQITLRGGFISPDLHCFCLISSLSIKCRQFLLKCMSCYDVRKGRINEKGMALLVTSY